MTARGTSVAALALAVIAAALALRAAAYRDMPGFPLDDAWIHLQFARNLHEYGRFSYFRDELVTAGSTSPAYTALLAFGMSVVQDERALAVGIGVLGLVAAVWLGRGRGAFGLVPAALIATEPRLQAAALTGMETTLFAAGVLSVLAFHRRRRLRAAGAALGALLFVRPEAIVLGIALVVPAVWARLRGGAGPDRRAWTGAALAMLGWAAYFALNFALSGTPMPNSVAAKLTFYETWRFSPFGPQLLRFLFDGPSGLGAGLACIGLADLAHRAATRRPIDDAPAALFALGVFALSWLRMPFLYQDGRYLVPALPALLLFAGPGVQRLGTALAARMPVARSQALAGAACGLALLLQAGSAWVQAPELAGQRRYIAERQVAAGRWLADHTDADAVVATHDVGAIAWFSSRRTADMVGLVAPQRIAQLADDRALVQFLDEQGTDYIAVLSDWFLVGGRDPVWSTDPAAPQVMEIFEYTPGEITIAPQRAMRVLEAAQAAEADGDRAAAAMRFDAALALAPEHPRLLEARGRYRLRAGELAGADADFSEALSRQPGMLAAVLGRIEVLAAQGRASDARAALAFVESTADGFDKVAALRESLTAPDRAPR